MQPVPEKKSHKNSNLLEKVTEFLAKTEEEVSIIEHQQCLCLVPQSSEKLMNGFIKFNPSINLDLDVKKEEPPQEKLSNDILSDFYEITGGVAGEEPLAGPKKRGRKRKAVIEVPQEDEFLDVPGGEVEEKPPAPKKRGRKRKVVEVSQEVEVKEEESPQENFSSQIVNEFLETAGSVAEEPSATPKKRGRKRKIVFEVPQEVPEETQDTKVEAIPESEGRTLRCNRSTTVTFEESSPFDYTLELSGEEKKWLREQIALSRYSDKLFTCSQCLKVLKSYAAVRYHIVNKHMKSRDSTKEWIAQQLKESELDARERGELLFKCTFCSKKYTSLPGLRYHIKLHAPEETAETTSNEK